MSPNNPQNWKPGHTLVFKEKDLTGLVSTPLFGFSVTIFLVKLSNKMFLEGKMIIYINIIAVITSSVEGCRGLQLKEIFNFAKVNSFHLKTVNKPP